MPGPEPPRDPALHEASLRVSNLLEAARPPVAESAVLAQARVAGRLFGAEAGGLGRFRVLDRLGHGGMGVVYAAYDPQLDRSVALKTVQVPTGRELALQEAKALAKLSHPNIVPVFDVGVEADQVYIVMELVRGQTLRDWVKDKDLRSILGAYRQAGLALAAAHAANLVHRDFKPDNAVVGVDGRVRVVDFGLACETTDSAAIDAAAVRPIAGTPKYMAPEQRSGGTITPAADQYSFSISLAEALPEALPPWVAAIVARGCAEQPSDRFASMHDLLRALGRDPRQRRRVAVVSVAVALTGFMAAAGLFARWTGGSAPCSGGDRELQATWSVANQQTTMTHIAELSPYGRTLSGLLDHQLAGYRARWIAGFRDSCLAQRAGEMPLRFLDRRAACLDQSRAGFATVAHIASNATADELPDVARAATALSDPESCARAAVLASDIEPPGPWIAAEVAKQREQLARARVQLAAANYVEARATTAQIVTTARALGYRPLLAEALLVDGTILLQTVDREKGVPTLRDATSIALEVHADELAVEAWARRAWLEGTQDDSSAHALDGVEVITALATRTTGAFPRALLYNNIGSVELGQGKRTEAKAAFERALIEATQVSGPGRAELIHIRQNLALALDDVRHADALLVDARTELAALLGSDHPDALIVEQIRATTTVEVLPQAEQLLAELCVKQERYVGLTFRIASCWLELADIRSELGNRTGAIAALDRAFHSKADELTNAAEARGYWLLWHEQPARAAAAFSSAIAATPSELTFARYVRAKLELGLGRVRAAQGRYAEARPLLESAIAKLQLALHINPVAYVQRRLARAHAELARVQARTGADPTSSATLALRWFRRSGVSAAGIAELELLRRQ